MLRLKLKEINYDYFDIVHFGIENLYLDRCGFISKMRFSDLLLQNFFEPQVNENTDDLKSISWIRNKKNEFFVNILRANLFLLFSILVPESPYIASQSL